MQGRGLCGLEKNVPRAIQLWSEAADLGSAKALFKMGMKYFNGGDGLAQDKAKAIRCWESAAMQGDVESRHGIGVCEWEKRKYNNALKHFMISAKMGY
ncbi:hypothetical protein THAOC_15366, partial [Thalassiosira oceanica]